MIDRVRFSDGKSVVRSGDLDQSEEALQTHAWVQRLSLKDFRAELGKGQVGVVRKTVHGDSPV